MRFVSNSRFAARAFIFLAAAPAMVFALAATAHALPKHIEFTWSESFTGGHCNFRSLLRIVGDTAYFSTPVSDCKYANSPSTKNNNTDAGYQFKANGITTVIEDCEYKYGSRRRICSNGASFETPAYNYSFTSHSADTIRSKFGEAGIEIDIHVKWSVKSKYGTSKTNSDTFYKLDFDGGKCRVSQIRMTGKKIPVSGSACSMS